MEALPVEITRRLCPWLPTSGVVALSSTSQSPAVSVSCQQRRLRAANGTAIVMLVTALIPILIPILSSYASGKKFRTPRNLCVHLQ